MSETTEEPTTFRVYARNVYNTGAGGIFQIMEETGKGYDEVRFALSEAGVQLVTGGPHDTASCRHDHRLAFAHATGRCQHRVSLPRRSTRERKSVDA